MRYSCRPLLSLAIGIALRPSPPPSAPCAAAIEGIVVPPIEVAADGGHAWGRLGAVIPANGSCMIGVDVAATAATATVTATAP